MTRPKRFPITRITGKELSCCDLCFALTTPNSMYGGRWIAMLFHSDDKTYTGFYADGSPWALNPYQHKVTGNRNKFKDVSLISQGRLVATVQEEHLTDLLRIFYETEPGPDQCFITRFFWNLAVTGMIEHTLPFEMLADAQYAKPDWDYYEGRLAPVDQRFVDSLGGAQFWLPGSWGPVRLGSSEVERREW
ncbi:hypothetical protein BJX99DRAFT_263640 [Aspergillus californicus]